MKKIIPFADYCMDLFHKIRDTRAIIFLSKSSKISIQRHLWEHLQLFKIIFQQSKNMVQYIYSLSIALFYIIENIF